MKIRFPKAMKFINLLLMVSFIIVPIYPSFAQVVDPTSAEGVVSVTSDTAAIVDEVVPPEVKDGNTEGDVTTVDLTDPTDEEKLPVKDGITAGDKNISQKLESQKANLGEVDEHSGAFMYSYSFPLPPFRNMNPELSLNYDSQNKSKNSVTGYGWDLSLPYIRQLNRKGTGLMYGGNYFYSSLSGELDPINIDSNGIGTYGTQNASGSFLSYVKNQDGSWTMKTKEGLVYVFGLDNSSRQYDPTNVSKIYNWNITSITDLNNNQITYTYFKEEGQIYPNTMTYGPYSIVLTYSRSESNKITQYGSNFAIKSTKKLSTVEVSFNNTTVHVYNILYSLPQFNRLSLLQEIVDNSVPSNPKITDFNYEQGSYNYVRDPNWDMPYYLNAAGTPTELISGPNMIRPDLSKPNEIGANGIFIDINNDGLIDFVNTTAEKFENDGGSPYNDKTKTVFINNGHGFVRDPNWDMPYYSNSVNNFGHILDNKSAFTDINNDGLVDFVVTNDYGFVNDGGSPYNDYFKTVFINNGHGFVRDPNWDMPYSTKTKYAIPLATNSALIDVNADGYVDFVCMIKTGVNNNEAFINDGDSSLNDYTDTVFINNGHGFVRDPNWDMPYKNHNGIYKLFFGANSTFTDLNNDGLVDFINTGAIAFDGDGGSPYNDGIDTVFINNGHGFVRDPNWDMPYYSKMGITTGLPLADYASTLTDLNNDGLPDFIYTEMSRFSAGSGSPYNDQTKTVFINNGHGFVRDPNWDMPHNDSSGTPTGYILSLNTIFTDVNNDGLSDFVTTRIGSFDKGDGSEFDDSSRTVFINTGVGFVRDPNWDMPHFLDIKNVPYGLSLDASSFFADINNDGLTDFVATCDTQLTCNGSRNDDRTFPNDGGSPYNGPDQTVFIDAGIKDVILNSITTSTGGTVGIKYKEKGITNFFSSGARMPQSVPVVDSVNYNDLVNPISTTNYSYENGKYYSDGYIFPSKRFAGFGIVTKTDSLGNITKKYYHQGNNRDDGLGGAEDYRTKIGKVYRIEEWDKLGNLYNVTINKWDHSYIKNEFGNVFDFVKLIRETNLNYDGNNSHVDTSVTYLYDDHGNLIKKINYGRVNANNDGTFTDVGNDDSSETISYAKTSDNVTYLPYEDKTYDHFGNRVAVAKNYYDSLSAGLIEHGNLTKGEQWVYDSLPPNPIEIYITNKKTYNGYGLVTSETNPLGKMTTYAYDSFNLYPISVKNPLGQIFKYEYDYTIGKVKQIIDQNQFIYQTSYDGLGRVTEEKIPSLVSPYSPIVKTSYVYVDTTKSMNLKKIDYLDTMNNVVSYEYYDGFGRLIQERNEAEVLNNFNVKDIVYNSEGQVLKQSLPYNSFGNQMTTRTNVEALYTNNAYDPVGRISTIVDSTGTIAYSYDDWKTTTVDKNGKIKNYCKDAYGNLIKVEEINNGSIYTTNYEWNLNKKLAKITDALGNVRNFTYDSLGRRLSAEDLHALTDTSFGSWSYSYDSAGNLIKTIDPKSQIVNYTYNDLNQILTEDSTATGGIDKTYTYGGCYNGVGKLCVINQSSGLLTTYSYDTNGNVINENKTIAGVVYTTSYTYDYLGHLLTLVYPDGGQVKYTYNIAGLLEKIERKESGGAFVNVISNFDYNPMNQVVTENYPNLVTTNTYDINKLYRLTRRQTIGNGSNFQDLNYTYDNAGNITQIMDASNTASAKTVNYTYDDLYRLINVSGTYSQSFSYDPIGNLTSGPAGNYSYLGNTGNLKANPHAATSIGGANNTYDDNGNLLTNGNIINAWNYNNQLTEVKIGTNLSDYTYDSSGERATSDLYHKLSNNTLKLISTAIYPNDYYNTYSQAGVVLSPKKTKQIYAGSQLVATIETTVEYNQYHNLISVVTPYYIHADHLGSTSAVSNSSGSVVESLDYYPYGAQRVSSGSHTEQRQYIGEISDSDTGLDYLNARYYDGARGRFISQDSMFWNFDQDKDTFANFLNNPQVQNSYSYANGNPVNNSDPKGKWSQGQIEGANYLYENSSPWRFLMDNPYLPAVVGTAPLLGYGIITGATALSIAYLEGAGTACWVLCGSGVEIGDKFGKLGEIVPNVGQKIIDFGIHGEEKMLERGLTAEIMQATTNNPLVKLAQDGGNKFLYLSEQAGVVLDTAGKVITTYAQSNFKPEVIDLISKILNK